MTEKEMHGEIAALVGAIAKALDLSEADTARHLEAGDIAMVLGDDERGERFVQVTCQGRTAKIYQGAIRHGAG